MRLDDFFFWQDWPFRRHRRYYQTVALLWLCFWGGLFVCLLLGTVGLEKATSRLKRSVEQVRPVSEEIQSLEAQIGQLASLSPLAATQQVARELSLDGKLASIRPKPLGGGQEGVQVLYESLDLGEFLNLLDYHVNRGGMKILSCNVLHRMDNPRRIDLQLVLTR